MNDYERFLELTVYQIYPKSFFDSNGDGVGDMVGITQKLDYIKELGANAIWICPMYKSPQYDNGYDVSNYRDFDEKFGTFADFKNLLLEAEKRGIKVIMDLVANHTSHLHPWFQEAKKSRKNPYHDYYYWSKKPLNKWKSVFGGSAWAYNEETDEYYLHSFAKEQPDVNWTNVAVRKEFQEIVDFWLSQGVYGFRCDVLDFISKDFEKGKMYDGAHFHDYVRELFGREGVKNAFTVGECQTDEKKLKLLCGAERKELKCAFQFEHLDAGRANKYTPKKSSLFQVAKTLVKWQNFTQENGLLCTLLTDNHDQPWYNSRVGNDKEFRYESATLLATMTFALRGIPFVFQGQEIGSANSYFDDITCFCDVETRNYHTEKAGKHSEQALMEKINFSSRDNARRPFAWSGDENRGFTTAKAPWLDFGTRSGEINVETDLKAEKSVVKYYRKLFALRKERVALKTGEFKQILLTKSCFVYERKSEKERLLIICNFEKPTKISGLPDRGKVLLCNAGKADETINRSYTPYETAIYEIE